MMKLRSLLVVALLGIGAAACGSQQSTPEPTPTEPTPTEPTPTEPGDVGSAPGDSGGCVATGCSGTVCAEAGEEIVTTCEWRPEYACYQQATCERQPSGECGWTPTPELEQCLANPPQE